MASPSPLKMFLPMGLMYGMKYIDQEDPQNIMLFRFYFFFGQMAMLALWRYVYHKIQSVNDERTMDVSEADLQPSNPLGDMLGADKLLPEEKKVKKPMKYVDYDMKQVNEKMKGIFMQGLIVGGIHYQWGSVLPLIMSTTMALMDVPENALVKIYLLGKKDTEDPDLKRPWKAKSPFSGMQEAMEKAKKETESSSEEHKAIEAEDEEPAEVISLKGTEPLGIRLASSGGHFIGEVNKDGQAAKAGFEIGHRILRLNGEDCTKDTHEDLLFAISQLKEAGKDIELEVRPNKSWASAMRVALDTHKASQEGEECNWEKVFHATTTLHRKFGSNADKDKIKAACEESFTEFEVSAAAAKKQKEGPDVITMVLMVYCVSSFFLPIKPSDIMNMISGNKTEAAASVAGAAAAAGGAVMGAGADVLAVDEFDDL